jgi:hypothetical protein
VRHESSGRFTTFNPRDNYAAIGRAGIGVIGFVAGVVGVVRLSDYDQLFAFAVAIACLALTINALRRPPFTVTPR